MSDIKRGVSFYSYQQTQFFKQLDLESQIRELSQNLYGADGFEILDEMSLPKYPNPPDEFVDKWYSWLDKYKAVPVTMDVFMDVLQFRDHVMSYHECAERLIGDIRLAKKLGFQNVPSDPNDQFAGNETADIRVHMSGDFLYVSNRGHNSIAVFKLNKDGRIKEIDRIHSGGEIPRAINFDIIGDMLYAANQRSGNVVQFRVDGATGYPVHTGYDVQLNFPVCIEILQL